MHPATYQEDAVQPVYPQHQPVRRTTERTCLAYVPWMAIFSSIIVIIGIGFWANNGVEGGRNANGALSALGVKYTKSHMVERAIVGTSVVLIFLLIGIVGVSLYRCLLEYRRDTEGRLDKNSLYLTLNASANSALWFMTLWVYIAFGIFAIAAASAYALDKVADASIHTFDKQFGTAKTIYDAAQDFVTFYDKKMNATATNPLDPLQAKVLALKKELNNKSACPAYCLDLTRLTFLTGDRCICDSVKLRASQLKAHAAWKALIPAIFGVVIVFCGCTWLIMNLVAQFVRTDSDMKWTRDTEEVLNAANQQQQQRYYSYSDQPGKQFQMA